MRGKLLFILAIAALCCALPTSARAQTLLRWKLQQGETFLVETRQQTQSQVAFSGQAVTTKIELGLTCRWSVTRADDKGMAISQTIERLEIKLESPSLGAVEYDSAGATRPAGHVREIADSLKPLLGAQVEIAMNDLGEVLSAKPANPAAEAMFANHTKGEKSSWVSRGDVEHVLRRPLIVLPEKPIAEGESWTRSAAVDSDTWRFAQTLEYRSSGLAGQNEEQVAKIAMTGRLEPASKPVPTGGRQGQSTIAVKSHSQNGTIQFSVNAGRMIEAEQTQELVTERPYRDTTIVVNLVSTQKTTVKPAVKEKPAAAGSPAAAP